MMDTHIFAVNRIKTVIDKRFYFIMIRLMRIHNKFFYTYISH